MQMQTFSDRNIAAQTVAQRLADVLRRRLQTGPAALALPGGTTPAPVMQALSQMDLDWARVTVLPGDERCVPQDHPRSNAGLIRRNLLQGPAAAARLLPLTLGLDLQADLDSGLPLTVALLGMGQDAHVASLFPGAGGLAAALGPDAPDVVSMQAPDGEARLSLSARVLQGAQTVMIFITGAEKRAVITNASGRDPMQAPVALLLDRAGVYWAE